MGRLARFIYYFTGNKTGNKRGDTSDLADYGEADFMTLTE